MSWEQLADNLEVEWTDEKPAHPEDYKRTITAGLTACAAMSAFGEVLTNSRRSTNILGYCILRYGSP